MCRNSSPLGNGRPNAPLDEMPFAVDELQFDETQQIPNVVLAFARRLQGDLLIFPQDGWKPELTQVI